MDELTKAFYEMKFKDCYREKNGNAFQDLFSDIMERCYPGNFQRIHAGGRIGDKKCDGYLRTEHTVFQVYAPEKMVARKAIAKIDADFHGALEHWSDHMKKWIFVHNAKALDVDVYQKILELETAYHSVHISSWGYPELFEHVFTLSETDLISLLGFAPSNMHMSNIRYEHIQEVLRHVAYQDPSPLDLRPVPPGKLQFNHLSGDAQILLEAGMRKANLVGNFFRNHADPLYGDRMASAFSAEYKKLRLWSADPDLIFRKLQQFTGGQSVEDLSYQAAVFAVLAHFFEQCDIFERPPEEATL